MNNIKIKKAKIKDSIFLDVEYIEELPGHSKKDTKLSCTVPIHDDLSRSFAKLHTHLAILCDEVKAPNNIDFDTVEYIDFAVRSFSIGGNDENEGVTISGYKDGKYGMVNLNSPFTKWEESEYPYISELGEHIDAAVHEVEQYLFYGKRAPEKQLGIDFGEDHETETK